MNILIISIKVHNHLTESADPISDAISTFESHPSIIKIKSDLIRSNDLFDLKKPLLRK